MYERDMGSADDGGSSDEPHAPGPFLPPRPARRPSSNGGGAAHGHSHPGDFHVSVPSAPCLPHIWVVPVFFFVGLHGLVGGGSVTGCVACMIPYSSTP